MKVSFVVPCYNEEKNIKLFYEDLQKHFLNKKYEVEIVFINDGSKDNTLQELKKLLHEKHFFIKIINFSKNFGKEAAIYAGLKKVTGDLIVLIDADMQQPPKLVLNMIKEIEKNENIDIVAYYQEKRKENFILSFTKKIYYKLIYMLTGLPFYNGASDFRLMKSNVKDAILMFSEHNRFSKGIFAYIGFETKYLPYIPEERANGKSKWNFKKLLKYGIDGIFSFSNNPAILISVVSKILFLLLIVLFVLSFFIKINYIYIVLILLFFVNFKILKYIFDFIFKNYTESLNRPIYIEKEEFSNER